MQKAETAAHSALDSRVSSLETSMTALTSSVHQLTNHIDSLRTVVAEQQRPQWGNLIGAVGLSVTLVGAIGSSYIAPLNVNLAYHDKVLLERKAMIDDIQERLRINEGLANTNRRVFEGDINLLKEDLKELKTIGSALTRERLAVIENELRRLAPPSRPPPPSKSTSSTQ